ncbi:hypothetical protein VP01_1438g1 [Puccinia sorghi]|uniref:Uncharacterized protein n=1 Tax=Puccinia sorghi TaxID=27349 RepID=A0A0L6VKG2_9BASI|nr:hypothetical protein VP01_1438g1 [Puccinia sorghi]
MSCFLLIVPPNLFIKNVGYNLSFQSPSFPLIFSNANLEFFVFVLAPNSRNITKRLVQISQLDHSTRNIWRSSIKSSRRKYASRIVVSKEWQCCKTLKIVFFFFFSSKLKFYFLHLLSSLFLKFILFIYCVSCVVIVLIYITFFFCILFIFHFIYSLLLVRILCTGFEHKTFNDHSSTTKGQGALIWYIPFLFHFSSGQPLIPSPNQNLLLKNYLSLVPDHSSYTQNHHNCMLDRFFSYWDFQSTCILELLHTCYAPSCCIQKIHPLISRFHCEKCAQTNVHFFTQNHGLQAYTYTLKPAPSPLSIKEEKKNRKHGRENRLARVKRYAFFSSASIISNVCLLKKKKKRAKTVGEEGDSKIFRKQSIDEEKECQIKKKRMRWIVGTARAWFTYISKGWIRSMTICRGNKGGSGQTKETNWTMVDRIQTKFRATVEVVFGRWDKRK